VLSYGLEQIEVQLKRVTRSDPKGQSSPCLQTDVKGKTAEACGAGTRLLTDGSTDHRLSS